MTTPKTPEKLNNPTAQAINEQLLKTLDLPDPTKNPFPPEPILTHPKTPAELDLDEKRKRESDKYVVKL